MVKREPPSVPGGAGDAHHRPHGYLKRTLCQAAWLHHSSSAAWFPCQNRWVPDVAQTGKKTAMSVHFGLHASLLPTCYAFQRFHSFTCSTPEWPSVTCAAAMSLSARWRFTSPRTPKKPVPAIAFVCLWFFFRLRGRQNDFLLSNLRSVLATLPVWSGSLCVRAPRGLRHPRPGPQWANEGRGRQSAAVRHTAKPAGRRHRERPGQISFSQTAVHAVELLVVLLCHCLVNQPGKIWTFGIFQVTIWEALTNSRPMPQSPMYEEDSQLERWAAITSLLHLL